MSVKDANVDKDAAIGKKFLVIPVTTAVSLTDAVIFSLLVGFKYQITRVRSFCRTKAGTVTFKVKSATRESVAAGTFTPATEVAQTISTTKANIRGSASEVLTVELTTDGSGALTNGIIVVELRPRPMSKDIGPT